MLCERKIIGFILAVLGMFFSPLSAADKKAPAPVEQTLSMIKPDAVAANEIGQIVSRFEKGGLSVVAARMLLLSPAQAESFYAIHKERPFYRDLIAYMSSGPIFVQVLEGIDAVAKNRQLMGSTDPKKAAKGTIRADFGKDIQHNAVHGSDSLENAKKEIEFFFEPNQIFSSR